MYEVNVGLAQNLLKGTWRFSRSHPRSYMPFAADSNAREHVNKLHDVTQDMNNEL